MAFLGALFVGKPLTILAVASLFYLLYGVLRAGRGGRAFGALLAAAIAWTAYAGWEYLVFRRTPEANIRVDLLVLWPVLAALSLWAVYRAIRA